MNSATMLELPWYNETHAQPQPAASSPAPDAKSKISGDASANKSADEQYRSALRGAVKNLTSAQGGLLKDPVVLPCGHVGDYFEAAHLYKQKEARLKRAECSDRKEQLLASAKKTYVCMQCPADQRQDIGRAPDKLPKEPAIGKFVTSYRKHIPTHIDDASAEALELLKSDLRASKVRIPKLPHATPKVEKEQAAYNCAVGESLVRDDKLSEAGAWFQAAVTADPEHRTYNRNMGVWLTKQNKKAEAAPYLLKADVPQAAHPQSHESAGYDLLVEGHFAQAEAYFLKALEREPLSSRLHSFVGTCASSQGDHKKAHEHYNKALSMRPENAKYQRDVGYSLFMLGRYSEADTHLNRALKIEPDNARFTYELAWCQRKLGNKQKAVDLLNKAIAQDPDNAGYRHDLGLYYFIQKKYYDARGHLAQANKLAPDNKRFADGLQACDNKILKKANSLMGKIKDKFEDLLYQI